jgi:hypothetical protein
MVLDALITGTNSMPRFGNGDKISLNELGKELELEREKLKCYKNKLDSLEKSKNILPVLSKILEEERALLKSYKDDLYKLELVKSKLVNPNQSSYFILPIVLFFCYLLGFSFPVVPAYETHEDIKRLIKIRKAIMSVLIIFWRDYDFIDGNLVHDPKDVTKYEDDSDIYNETSEHMSFQDDEVVD